MIRPRKWYVHRGVVALTALAFCSLPKPQLACGAQDAAAKAEEEKWAVDRSLSLSPRSETAPALKHRLFPMAVDLKEGNAVPIYLRLVHEQNDEARKLWRDKSAEWNKLPLDKLPLAEARKFLDDRKYMMKQLDLGARRTSAEWNYTLDAGDPIGLLLPDAQGMRIYGSLLTLKARVELAEGNYAAATQTLQTGFAMSRHVAEGPFLVNGLVAVAVATQLADVLLDWVSRADAPNLYWSITALPRPLIDFRKEMDIERRMVELQFPELANLERERTPSEWEAGLRQLRTHFERLEALEKGNPNYPRKPLTGTAPSDPADRSPELPAAKKFLVDRLQIPAAKVDAMPAAQILMLHISGVNEEMQDEMYRGAYLPLEQATPLLLAADKRLKSLTYAEATRMPIYFVAAIPKVVLAPNRLERRLAALRTIEAMRAYAAAHDGRLPSKLDDITEMPVPADPGTGQPFEYRQSNATATLIAPVLSLATPKSGLRYSLTMKSKD